MEKENDKNKIPEDTLLYVAADEEASSAHAQKEPSETPNEKPKKSGWKYELISWLQIIVGAFVLAFLLNNFVIANSKVPTGSMETTIMPHDRVIGLRLSYTLGDPDYGDIAIFKYGWICNRCGKASGEGEAPDICPVCGQEITHPRTLYYVKRVIGMPGDVIDIKQDGAVKVSEVKDQSPELAKMAEAEPDRELVTAAVYRNGEKLEESYINGPMLYTGDLHYEVPADSYFFLGDNRNNSGDSRYWKNPYIADEKMVAKVLFRYFPHPAILH